MIVSFIFNIDPKISYVPVSIIQFVTRNSHWDVMGYVYAKIANKVKNGEMKEHARAIESKKDSHYTIGWTSESKSCSRGSFDEVCEFICSEIEEAYSTRDA